MSFSQASLEVLKTGAKADQASTMYFGTDGYYDLSTHRLVLRGLQNSKHKELYVNLDKDSIIFFN